MLAGQLGRYHQGKEPAAQHPLQDELFAPADVGQGGEQGAGDRLGVARPQGAAPGGEAELDGAT